MGWRATYQHSRAFLIVRDNAKRAVIIDSSQYCLRELAGNLNQHHGNEVDRSSRAGRVGGCDEGL